MSPRAQLLPHRPLVASTRWTYWVVPALGVALLLGTVVGGPGCDEAKDRNRLTVSAAMSLRDAFTTLGRRFAEQHPGKRVTFNFAGSGVLATQILRGAPVDAFASASLHHLDRVERGGLVLPGTRVNIARNALVVVQPRGTKTRITDVAGLRRLGRVAIGNPASVPAGRYARAMLSHHGLWAALGPKLVFGEHVRQVLDYVGRGEVDAGVVYATDYRQRAAELVLVARAAPGSHPAILYPMAVLKGSTRAALARQFLALVRSAEGQAILARHGFLPAAGPPVARRARAARLAPSASSASPEPAPRPPARH